MYLALLFVFRRIDLSNLSFIESDNKNLNCHYLEISYFEILGQTINFSSRFNVKHSLMLRIRNLNISFRRIYGQIQNI